MKRTIGLYEGVALYVVAVLGSGVLFLSGVTATIAGPASLLSWLMVSFISLPLAYTFACLAREYPDAGGAATFVRRSFGYHCGNIIGWFYFVTAAVGQTVVSMTGAFYLNEAFHLSGHARTLVACMILIIAGVTNYYGVKISGKVALGISSCLLLLLILAIFLSIPFINWNRFTPFVTEGWYSVGTAITLVFWAFFGWEAICNLANHFKNPKGEIVKSTFISVLMISMLFISLSVVTIGTGTYGNVESDLSPISVMLGERLGIGAKLITGCLALLICIGTSNAFVASLGQLGYALSRDGAFPKKLSVLQGSSQIPRRMIVFVVSFAIAGVITTELLSMTFKEILFIPTSLGIVVYIFSMAAGVKLFTKKQLPWWCSLLSLILCILVLPFFEFYIFVPVIVMFAYFMYMLLQNRMEKGDAKRERIR